MAITIKALVDAFLQALKEHKKAKRKNHVLNEANIRFRKAVAFAKMVRRDATWSQFYLEQVPNCKSVFHLALRDALVGPHLCHPVIHPSKPCKPLMMEVQASDNVGVARVFFQFKNSKGELLEEGRGMPGDKGSTWSYSTTARAKDFSECFVTITAYDLAGNKAVIHKSL
ncbi:hypothetical protein L0U88_07290 [Flavihumibacter sp. RY-1]|uniref:Uncharacterized protein n=1 Tax=Flavihumibacter fluminis TaxID=2909236 RepID=A0ABS9BH58_9BACT|nr:hypothetical protein [Flavihumibacter fluminis]MCF1714427.1 hypothetical protein [Flavihumibacter fluminis]